MQNIKGLRELNLNSAKYNKENANVNKHRLNNYLYLLQYKKIK